MAAVAGTLMAKALGALGKALAGKAAEWIFKKATASFSAKDSIDMRKELKSLSNQITQVQQSIDSLGSQISAGLLDIRKDLIETQVIKIDLPFEQVFACLDACLDAENEKDASKREKLIANSQSRLTELLKQCRAGVAEALYTIDRYLSNTEARNITRQASDQAWKDSSDFISYLLKMQAFVKPLWLAEAKAIILLQMAATAPDVIYPDGQAFIDKYTGDNGKLSVQEKLFEGIVGAPTIRLVDYIIANPAVRIPIQIKTFDGRNLVSRERKSAQYGRDYIGIDVQEGARDDEVQWYLMCKELLKELNPNKSYLFAIGIDSISSWARAEGKPGPIYSCVIPHYNDEERPPWGSRAQLWRCLMPDYLRDPSCCQWSIKPGYAGAFSVQFISPGESQSGHFLAHSNVPAFEGLVTMVKDADWENPKFIWHLSPRG